MSNEPKPMEAALDQVFERVERELLARLNEGECDECGRTSVTVGELDMIRRWINDHGYVRPAYRPGEQKGPASLTHGAPFTEEDTPHKAQAGG